MVAVELGRRARETLEAARGLWLELSGSIADMLSASDQSSSLRQKDYFGLDMDEFGE